MRPHVPGLEPRFVADETINLGKINLDAAEFKKAPSWYALRYGGKKLTQYFQNPQDPSKTRYYLMHNAKCNYLLTDQGMLILATDNESYGALRFVWIGMYIRQQGASLDRIAPGGFIQCGDSTMDTETSEMAHCVKGYRDFCLHSYPDELKEFIIDDGAICKKFAKYKPTTAVSATELADLERTVRDYKEKILLKDLLGTISFKCLSRFLLPPDKADTALSKVSFPKLLDAMKDGDIVFTDMTSDHVKTVRLTAAECDVFKQQLRKQERDSTMMVKAKRPAPGYVCTSNYYVDGELSLRYHRSGNVLVTHVSANKQIVMGVDDGSYFGCELSPDCGQHTTAADALLSLAPREAREFPLRKASPLKAGTLRQGEWFFVKYSKGGFPHPLSHPCECLSIEEVIMPKVSPTDSNHILSGGNYSEENSTAWVHLPTGSIWATRALLEHAGEHPDLQVDLDDITLGDKKCEAYKILRNLAARSFSEKGVD